MRHTPPEPMPPLQPRWRILLDWLCALAIVLAAVALTRPTPTTYHLPVAALDQFIAQGFYAPEISADDRLFRWTSPDATLMLPVKGLGNHILTVTLAAPGRSAPEPIDIDLGGRSFAHAELAGSPRHYQLLIPSSRVGWPRTTFTLRSPPIRVPGDARLLGIVLYDGLYHVTDEQPFLPPLQLAVLVMTCLLLGAVLRRLGTPALVTVVLFASISLALGLSETRFVQRVAATVLIGALGLVLALVLTLLHQRPAFQPPPSGENTLTRPELSLFVLVFAVLGAIPLLPVLADPAHLLLGTPGDNFEYAWKMQWFVDALVTLRHSVLFQPRFFVPAGFDLARSELTPAHTLLGLPLTLLVGPVAAVNLEVYASYVATGVLGALLAARIGAGRVGALVAGIGMTFSQHHYVYSLGTLPMAGTHWVILAFYGLEGFVQRRRPLDAWWIGMGIAVARWASWYYGPLLIVMLAVYTLARCRRTDWQALRASWPAALVAPVVILVLVAPYMQPYLALGSPPHARAELVELAAHPLGYLAPSPFHTLWGRWAQSLRAAWNIDEYVAIGWGMLILAVWGAIRRWRQPVARALIVMACAAFILSLGPELRLGGQTVPLPVEWIYQYIPGLKNIRVWSRMSFFVQISASLLAAYALSERAAWPRWRRIATVVIVGLVLLEIPNLPPAISPTNPRPVDTWLASRPDNRPIVQVPDVISGYGEFYALYNKRRMISGYGTFYPEWFLADLRVVDEFPSRDAVQTLRRMGAGYVLVRHDLMDARVPSWRQALASNPDLERVYVDETTTVYAVRPLK